MSENKEEENKEREYRWWENADGTGSDKLVMLKQAFAFGCTDLEACVYADISETQLYYYQEKNPDFTSEKHRLKEKVVLQARKNVVDRILQEDKSKLKEGESLKSAENSWRYLEKKKKKEFGNSLDITSGDEPITKIEIEIIEGNKHATQNKDDNSIQEESSE